MNTNDELLIIKKAYPEKYKEVFDRFRKSLNRMPDGETIPDASIDDSLAESIGNDWDWLPQGIDSPETRENLCRNLKISVWYDYEHSVWIVANDPNRWDVFTAEPQQKRMCNSDEEIKTAINECALAIIKEKD